MYRKNYRGKRSFARYIRKTAQNKLSAIAMVAMGVLVTILDHGDATALMVILMFAVPMFFSKESWFE